MSSTGWAGRRWASQSTPPGKAAADIIWQRLDVVMDSNPNPNRSYRIVSNPIQPHAFIIYQCNAMKRNAWQDWLIHSSKNKNPRRRRRWYNAGAIIINIITLMLSPLAYCWRIASLLQHCIANEITVVLVVDSVGSPISSTTKNILFSVYLFYGRKMLMFA